MRVPHLCALAVLFMPALQLSAAEIAPPAELIDTGPAGVAEAMNVGGDDTAPASGSEASPHDEVNAVSVMRPIAISKDADAAGRVDPRLAAIELPDAEPLVAAKVIPVALRSPSFKEMMLKSKLVAEPLSEMVARENLEASPNIGPVEPLEPVEITSTKIQGRRIAEPLTVIISLKDQQLDVYRGLERVETTRVSSGKRGYQTLTGVFGILQKKPEHYSNLYDNAPMPWMQRLTRSGTAIHAGVVPNYPASHGCVRMPNDFAPRLFRMTEIGGKVAMLTGAMVKPERIESAALVMPASNDAASDGGATARVSAGLRQGALAAALSPRAKRADADSSDTKPSGAKPQNEKPWHILVTRREERDIAIGTQEALAAMGYLKPQDKFVGYLGSGTRKAILAFEKDHGLRRRGVFNERIAAKIYEAAGKGPLPDAYLFLRKGFSRVRHVPVQLRDPKKPLGTHLFTYVHPSDGSEPGWVGMSLEGEDSKTVLDRITIPRDMQDEIAAGLAPGASYIVADVGKHSSVLPEGDDFIVRTNDSAKSNAVAEKAKAQRRKFARQRAAQPKKRVVRVKPQRKTRNVRRASGPRGFGGMFRRR
ncbi:MAG: L,D-transpeptidase family protein [Methyloceanibacter sp.]|nr:L,D-transpeptidase family protein [Methyloceanibacter sp.]